MKRFESLLFLVGLFGEAIGDDQKSFFWSLRVGLAFLWPILVNMSDKKYPVD